MIDLLAYFPKRTKAGDGWMVPCPAHDDQHASLSISRGDHQPWILKCHAGCSVEAIVATLGLTMQDLLTPRMNGGDIVAIYDYVDESGTLIFQVCRTSAKKFFQRRPDGAGGWINGLGPVRRVLYRLPALTGQRTVWIVEGEKDVDRLHALGQVATTNPMGAGKWREDYTQQIIAAGVTRVLIIGDNDDAGRDHAMVVVKSCHAAGRQVKVIALPGVRPKGDVSDWLDAGHTLRELIDRASTTPTWTADAPPLTGRTVTLTAASTIDPRPVQWLWQGRLPLGTFNLLGGREGIGKSIVECDLVARITRGRMPGRYRGKPHAVIIAATEDAWSYTIVPRLMAAGADLEIVFRVDVTSTEGDVALSLPRDLPALERLITAHEVAALMLDPIMSRLDAALDSHKDGEVRLALEPLSAMLERTGCMGLGLIHVNKSGSTDPLTTLMASRAFAAVARSVLFVMVNPDDDTTRLLGQPKNNLGRSDLPTLVFRIDGKTVATTTEGPVETGHLMWIGESDRSLHDAIQQEAEADGCNRTVVQEAADWMEDYLKSKDGSADSAEVKAEGKKAGHSLDAIHRARTKLKITAVSIGFPRRTHWKLQLSDAKPFQSSDLSGETPTTTTTQTTTAKQGIPDPTTGGQSFESSESWGPRGPRPTTANTGTSGTTMCCEGGDLQLKCKVCPRSPSYWQRTG